MKPTSEEELFAETLNRPVHQRAAFLDGACREDKTLRLRLEALLAAHDEPDALSPKDASIVAATIKLNLPDAPDEAVGQVIGRYKILEKVGEGGCGVVYVAEQTEPVRRRVALKVIKLGMDTKQVVARFEAERQALAMMDHPNIAKVLDAGATENGRPYFVMELVRGIKITEYCDQNNLTTTERLDLFIKVCQAIQHAHQKGIIHRDIKPSNILVTLHDGVPVPKVIDFGIAKATEGRLTDATVYTQLHQFIGMPAYMSPEQAEMSGLDIDTRSDIYSLGVLLYELLAGSTPFDPKELMASGLDQMRKTIREQEPVRPSTRFATLKGEELTTTAKRRSADTAKLMHQLKGDLDWIVMKCLEKDHTRRYETANGLAADLKRHLDNEPVLARPPSATYKFQKAFRRNKLMFAAGTAIAAALVLGVLGTSLGLVRAERERRLAEEQRRAAQEAQRVAEERFDSANQFVHDVFQKVAPEFQDLIGAAKANESLAHISLTFVQSLGEAATTNETYEASLADLYNKMADALGGIFSPNALGDYETALRFANQSLAISRNLLSKHPTDKERQRLVSTGERRVGTLLQVSGDYDEALVHMQRHVAIAEEILKANPTDATEINRLRVAHIHYASVLNDQGRNKEALEQYYRYGKQWLELPVPTSADPQDPETMWSYVDKASVGDIYLALGQPSKALPLYEQALQLIKLFGERQPNNARWPRNWSGLHGDLGTTQIALGRFDEGMTNLQLAVELAESLVAHDPANGLSQQMLAELLQKEGEGWMKVTGSPGISRGRRAEDWQRAIMALTRCEEKLDSPQLAHQPKSQLIKKRSEIESALNEARYGYAKIAGETKTNSSAK